MPDYFRKVRAGEPFRPAAPTWNAMLDAAQAHQRNNRTGGAPGGHEIQPVVVDVYNDTGEDVPAFGVLAVSGILVPPAADLQAFVNRPCLKVQKPSTSNADAKLVVTVNAISAGDIGRAVIVGLTVAKVDMQAATDTTAGPYAGDATKFKSGSGPVQILYAEGGSGVQWAVVLMGGGAGTLPVGQFRGQVYSMVADQATGWEFVQFTPYVPE